MVTIKTYDYLQKTGMCIFPVCVSSFFLFSSKIALTFEDRASCGQTMMILKALELRLLKQV